MAAGSEEGELLCPVIHIFSKPLGKEVFPKSKDEGKERWI